MRPRSQVERGDRLWRTGHRDRPDSTNGEESAALPAGEGALRVDHGRLRGIAPDASLDVADVRHLHGAQGRPDGASAALERP